MWFLGLKSNNRLGIPQPTTANPILKTMASAVSCWQAAKSGKWRSKRNAPESNKTRS
jgi:hypothetical protein